MTYAHIQIGARDVRTLVAFYDLLLPLAWAGFAESSPTRLGLLACSGAIRIAGGRSSSSTNLLMDNLPPSGMEAKLVFLPIAGQRRRTLGGCASCGRDR